MPTEKGLTFLTTNLAYGGAETQLVLLATRLKSRGWTVSVASMVTPSAFTEVLASADIPVLSLDVQRGTAAPMATARLVRALRRWKPQVLHCHMVHANLLGRLLRPLTRVPVLVSAARSIQEGPRWREIAYRLTDRLCDMTTQVSQAGADRYVRVGAVPRAKLRVIPNGIDTARFRVDPASGADVRRELDLGGRFLWLAVGRLDIPKDYPTLLEAFSRVRLERDDATLLIAGQGPLAASLAETSARLGLGTHVRLLGHRRDVPALMNAADAYVMSSAWEGMPNVLLEASASGLPIVATDVGGNGEVVLDGASGFLVPPRDPEALADAMLRVMALGPEERRRMGQAGRAHVERHYDIERVVDQWEALYLELLQRKGVRVTGAPAEL